MINSIPDSPNVKMITLTYHSEYVSERTSKKHLDTFFKRLRRYVGAKAFYVWKKEYQKRGTLHYHILVYDCPFIPRSWLATVWNDITGEDFAHRKAGTRIEKIRKMQYVSKYVDKPIEKLAPEDSGRYWGIINRQKYDLAIGETTVDITRGEYYRMRRIIRKHAKKMRKRNGLRPLGTEKFFLSTRLPIERIIGTVPEVEKTIDWKINPDMLAYVNSIFSDAQKKEEEKQKAALLAAYKAKKKNEKLYKYECQEQQEKMFVSTWDRCAVLPPQMYSVRSGSEAKRGACGATRREATAQDTSCDNETAPRQKKAFVAAGF